MASWGLLIRSKRYLIYYDFDNTILLLYGFYIILKTMLTQSRNLTTVALKRYLEVFHDRLYGHRVEEVIADKSQDLPALPTAPLPKPEKNILMKVI